MTTKKKGGFTLLELLIVVIIVGILAGFALPQFARVTRRARMAEARNMIGAIMTAELIYYQERDTFVNFADNAAATGAGLDVTLPLDANNNWDYSATGAGAANVTVNALGDNTGPAGTAVDGISVTGLVRNDGSRQIN